MPTIEQITRFFETYWPALLALGSLTTFINNIVQRLPDRFARLKNIVNTVSVDFVALLAEVGGAMGLGPRKPPPSDPPNGTVTRIVDGLAKKAVVMVVAIVAALMAGCLLVLSFAACGSSLQDVEAKALPVLTQGQAVAELVKRACDVAEQHGVSVDSVKAAKAALDQGDVGQALVLGRGLLQSAADLGAKVPPELLAGVDLALTLRDVQGLEAFAHWSAVPAAPKDGGP